MCPKNAIVNTTFMFYVTRIGMSLKDNAIELARMASPPPPSPTLRNNNYMPAIANSNKFFLHIYILRTQHSVHIIRHKGYKGLYFLQKLKNMLMFR